MNFLIIGLCGGLISSLLGVGTGTIFVPVFTILYGVPQLQAQATSLLLIFLAAGLSYLLYHKQGLHSWKTSVSILPFAIVGILIGVKTATLIPTYWLRKIFGIVLIWAAYRNYKSLPSMSDSQKIR